MTQIKALISGLARWIYPRTSEDRWRTIDINIAIIFILLGFEVLIFLPLLIIKMEFPVLFDKIWPF